MSVRNKECGISDEREHRLALKCDHQEGQEPSRNHWEGGSVSCWRLAPLFCKDLSPPLATASSLKLRELSQVTIHSSQGFLALSSLLYLHIYSDSPVTSYSVLNFFCADNNIHCVWYEALDEPTVYREQSVTLPSQLIKPKPKDSL